MSRSHQASRERARWSSGAQVLLCVVMLLVTGCAQLTSGRVDETVQPLRLSALAEDGDAARRASTRLIVEGLRADRAGEPARAQGSYERALQVDPTNPNAYLALARHHLDGDHPARALPLLDQAVALYSAEGLFGPEVEVHVVGLRGRAKLRAGRGEDGVLDLERARTMAPNVWDDGYLSADELL